MYITNRMKITSNMFQATKIAGILVHFYVTFYTLLVLKSEGMTKVPKAFLLVVVMETKAVI